MDCCCICQTGKCKAHLCMERQRQATPAHNCGCAPPKAIQIMADSNGRLLCPYKCNTSFPWGNYLKEQWIQPPCCSSKNACGRKHIPSQTQKLPSFFKQRLTPNLKCDDDKVYLVRTKGASASMAQTNSRTQLLNRAFQAFKSTKPPIIWIYGHPQCPIGPTRRQFAQELACKLGFQYVHFDTEILYWTDELLGRPNTEKVANLPEQHKRLVTMCIQLMGDEELHLNLTGTIELFKLIVLNKIISSSMNRSEGDSANPMPKGFILEGFPCTEQEASAFEKQFYPMTAGIYFQNRCWSNDKSREPDVVFPKYFRRDTPYSERKVEALVGRYGSRSIKILNVEKFAENEANFVTEAIEKKLGIRRNDANIYTQTPTSQMGCNPCCRRFERYENSKRMQQMSGNGFNGSSTITITCPLQTAQSQRELSEKPKRPLRERQREKEQRESPYYSRQEVEVDVTDYSVNLACPHEQQRSEVCSPNIGEADVMAVSAECDVVDVDVDNNFINGNCDELWTDVEVEECPAPRKVVKPRRPRLPKRTPTKPKSEPLLKLIVKNKPRPKSTIPKQRPLTPKPKAIKKPLSNPTRSPSPLPKPATSLPPPPPKPRINLTPPPPKPATSLPPPPPPSNPTTSLMPPPSTRRKSSIASSYKSGVPKTVDFAKKTPEPKDDPKKLVWDRSAIFRKDVVTLGTATSHVPSNIHEEDLPAFRKASIHPHEKPIDPRHNLMTLPSSPLAQSKNKKEELLYYY